MQKRFSRDVLHTPWLDREDSGVEGMEVMSIKQLKAECIAYCISLSGLCERQDLVAALANAKDRSASAPAPAMFECASCGWRAPRLFSCARCQSVKYCSVECQKKAWPSHKSKCIEKKRTRQQGHVTVKNMVVVFGVFVGVFGVWRCLARP